MNLYIRYFDRETLVHSTDEAVEFLSSIDEIGMTPQLEQDVRTYADSDVRYPKRYKVRPRVYFIIIKTDAQNMQEFKENRGTQKSDGGSQKPVTPSMLRLNEERPGWYEGTMDFKRVLMVPGTGKFQYRDTHFVARVKARSGMDCYQRIVDHLSQRVDPRSQFPSAKGKNFRFQFLGLCK